MQGTRGSVRNSLICKKSLDDIFMVWDLSLDSLLKFKNALTSFHPSAQVTYNISLEKVNFPDFCKSEDLNFAIDIHVKSTNVRQYVEYSSCHARTASL